MFQNTYKTSYGEVWSAPNTVKVSKDAIDFSDKREPKLFYQAVKNEYESAQLLITAEKNITGFELYVSDLRSDKHVLAASNIEVYVQKANYFHDHMYYGDGSLPDALIPMGVAGAYAENRIVAGQNGGLWVTIYIPKDIEAGIYEGTFLLALDGEVGKELIEIPVSAEIIGYTLSDDITARTLFSWRYDRVATGELNGSHEMMEYYYNFFKKYRISLQALPTATLNGEAFVEMVDKYYDELTSYTLLATVGEISTDMLRYPNVAKEQVLAIAARSTAERNLFDKAMTYILDEPPLSKPEGRFAIIQSITGLNAILQECVEDIEKDNSGLYEQFKQIENWKQSILGIKNIIPMDSFDWLYENEDSDEAQEILRLLNCMCPQFWNIGDDAEGRLKAICEKYHLELWWYGCMGPQHPHPNYHIGDKSLLSPRTVSWLQRMHKVSGNLYWDAAAYTDEAKEVRNEYINVYEEPYRITNVQWPAGDGFLAYPGAAYGVYGPLPSLRLMAIRDGMEEYEIVAEVERLYTELATVDKTISVSEKMDEFYKVLYFTAMRMNDDGMNGLDFWGLRSKLLHSVVDLRKQLEKVDIPSVDSEKAELLMGFDSYEEITQAGLRVSPLLGGTRVNTDKRYVSQGDASWMIQPEGDYGDPKGYPWFRMRCRMLEGYTRTTFITNDFTTYQKIRMDVYNASDTEATLAWFFTVCDKDETDTETKEKICKLRPNAWTTCEFDLTDTQYKGQLDWSDVKYMTVKFLDKKMRHEDEPITIYLDYLRGICR